MGELDKNKSVCYVKTRKKTNLKNKRKMSIIACDEDFTCGEISLEQLEVLNGKLQTIFEQYYSCNASIERIMSRNLFELIKIIFSKRKNK